MTTDKTNVLILVDTLCSHGVKDVVLCPGTRNAPLTVAFARDRRVATHLVIDERSAGFIALGMAVQSSAPVALVCTSGSAVLNFAPAVAEAFYREMPLVVISADRPEQWIDQDDSQTIRQPGILDNIVKFSCDIAPENADKTVERMVVRRINDSMIKAMEPARGPVHINMHLDVPLNRMSECVPCQQVIRALYPPCQLHDPQMRELASRLTSAAKVLIVAGFMSPDKGVSDALARLARRSNVVVMHEAQSNVHGHGMTGRIDSVLSCLSAEQRESMAPDVVITVGGSLVSRFVKAWLRRCRGLEHWHVGVRGMSVDCFNALKLRIELPPACFLPQLADVMQSFDDIGSDYSSSWRTLDARVARIDADYVKTVPWSDFRAMKCIVEMLPEGCNLHVSNGTAVRYLQLFDYSRIHRIECNRGVSGIDGCTSTALGASALYDGRTVIVTGDMSAQYDLSALSSSLVSKKFAIIVLNNGGGGIFRFIETTRSLPELEDYFAAGVNLPLRQLADGYGFDYHEAVDEQSLVRAMRFLSQATQRPVIINVVTPGAESAGVLSDYFNSHKI